MAAQLGPRGFLFRDSQHILLDFNQLPCVVHGPGRCCPSELFRRACPEAARPPCYSLPRRISRDPFPPAPLGALPPKALGSPLPTPGLKDAPARPWVQRGGSLHAWGSHSSGGIGQLEQGPPGSGGMGCWSSLTGGPQRHAPPYFPVPPTLFGKSVFTDVVKGLGMRGASCPTRVAPKPTPGALTKERLTDTGDREQGGHTYTGRRSRANAATSQGTLGPPKQGDAGKVLLGRLRGAEGEAGPTTPEFQTTGPQDFERIRVCCSKPLSSWSLVTTTPGS